MASEAPREGLSHPYPPHASLWRRAYQCQWARGLALRAYPSWSGADNGCMLRARAHGLVPRRGPPLRAAPSLGGFLRCGIGAGPQTRRIRGEWGRLESEPSFASASDRHQPLGRRARHTCNMGTSHDSRLATGSFLCALAVHGRAITPTTRLTCGPSGVGRAAAYALGLRVRVGRARGLVQRGTANGRHVLGDEALGAVLQLKLDALPLLEVAEPVAVDLRIVHEGCGRAPEATRDDGRSASSQRGRSDRKNKWLGRLTEPWQQRPKRGGGGGREGQSQGTAHAAIWHPQLTANTGPLSAPRARNRVACARLEPQSGRHTVLAHAVGQHEAETLGDVVPLDDARVGPTLARHPAGAAST